MASIQDAVGDTWLPDIHIWLLLAHIHHLGVVSNYRMDSSGAQGHHT